jgi:hypothetical protein
MPTSQFEYWQPGDEERKIRVFVSHRYGQDQALYDEVFQALHRNSVAVQDVSLSEQQVLRGPRGGRFSRLQVQAEIAARIYTSDILIAPSRVGAGRSEWVTWEVQLAAVDYGIPILFISQTNQIRRTSLVAQVSDLGLPHAVAQPNAPSIVSRLTHLVDGHPKWGFRTEENNPQVRFRGPPKTARDSVL